MMEAMLRGTPTFGSDIGGFREARKGVAYVLPVHPIGRYASRVDEWMIPIPAVPEEDIGPWVDGLQRLLSEWALHGQLKSRDAALAHVSGLGIEPFEPFLEDLAPASRDQFTYMRPDFEEPDKLSGLAAIRQTLLALRLRNNGQRAG